MRGLEPSLLAALTAASLASAVGVYVFEVELGSALQGMALHIPGLRWEFGEQALIFYVPVDQGEALYAFTGDFTSVRLYDFRRAYVAVPASRPPVVDNADFYLETAVGRYPVRLHPPRGGLAEIIVHSAEEVEDVLKQLGYEPQFKGRARLVRAAHGPDRPPKDAGRTPEAGGADAGAVQLAEPRVGTTVTALGGVYFRPAQLQLGSWAIVQPHKSHNIEVCSNAPGAMYVGYNASSMYLGVYVLGGKATGRIRVETYRVLPDMSCLLLGVVETALVNRSRVYVRHVNLTASRDYELAVRVLARADSVSGSPRLGVNGSVWYHRTYLYGFEVGQYASYSTGEPVTVNQYVSRLLLGPYYMPDGLFNGDHRVAVRIATSPVGGTCPRLYADWYINGIWATTFSARLASSNSASCVYELYGQIPLYAYGAEFAKSFSGAFYYTLKLWYEGTLTLPYVQNVVVLPHKAVRGWRWGEVWRGVRSNKAPHIWANVYTISTLQYVSSSPQQDSATRALALVHGMLLLRAERAGSPGVVSFLVGGRKDGRPFTSFEVEMKFSTRVNGAFLESYYAYPAGIEEIKEPWWIQLARAIAVDLAALLDLGGKLGEYLYSGLSFAVYRALDAAVTKPSITYLDDYTVRVSWNKGWADSTPADKLYVRLRFYQPYITTSVSSVTIRNFRVEYVSYSPYITAYLHPTASSSYDQFNPGQYAYVKIWTFDGLVDAYAEYQPR
ncbi:MAG: hypothetical protein QXI84_10530 [Thermofilaceae archaeon]